MKIPRFSYLSLAYFATLLTGFASLMAQVVWQKYLAILVGSETRSINLVVSIFLLGLALGYYVFGKVSRKDWSRFFLLKFYGWLEMITGLYMALFMLYFELLKKVSFNTPSSLWIDIFITLLALFFPTFLMGASIPILTSVLPKSSQEINKTHFKVYGWNAFGAFLGVLGAGFYFLPKFGLVLTLLIASLINVIAALIFIGNKLEGELQRKKEYQVIPSLTPNWFYILFSFFIGAVVISFEILFIRLLNVTLGGGVYNFPIVLSIFVGALSLGSLSVPSHKASPQFLIRQIFITLLLLGLIYMVAPYWSIWINHIRVSLVNISSNYFVFKFLVYLFCSLFLFPFVFFMGRLLPLSYVLLKKTKNNYGFICGYLYFFNTLGTVLGAIVLAYLSFYIFNLDEVFKINLLFLIILVFVFALYEKNKWSLAFAGILGFSLLLLPQWDREKRARSFFRTRNVKSYHFKKLFFIPDIHEKVLSFEDGPNVSTALVQMPSQDKIFKNKRKLYPEAEYQSVSFYVNGKAIGSSLGDFSTVFLLAGLSYLYAPKKAGLSSSVIGLGLGSTAGILANLEDIKDTTVLEIAPEVLEDVKRSPDFSFGLLDNPKARIITKDAFKYFTKTDKKFDIIVSEPSNPWIVGVENVFSYEFYELAKKSLNKEGVLVQWVQLYSIDSETLEIMFYTLKKVFPHAKIYLIGQADIAIVASLVPLRKEIDSGRFLEHSFLKPYYSVIGFQEEEDLILTQIFSSSLFSSFTRTKRPLHTLTEPKLAYRGDKTFFLGQMLNLSNLIPGYLSEDLNVRAKKMKSFSRYIKKDNKEIQKSCLERVNFFCSLILNIKKHKRNFEDKSKSSLSRMLDYVYLRKYGFIPYQKDYLEDVKKEMIEKKIKNLSLFFIYFNQLFGNQLYEQVQSDLKLFEKEGLLKDENLSAVNEHIEMVKKDLFQESI
ncbi:MAG: fused MFS/spermidine synthase [Bdellovibrionales bacterium]|nr:fused MFS/spermidine synthase [Bdellovibrionales bacterium]